MIIAKAVSSPRPPHRQSETVIDRDRQGRHTPQMLGGSQVIHRILALQRGVRRIRKHRPALVAARVTRHPRICRVPEARALSPRPVLRSFTRSSPAVVVAHLAIAGEPVEGAASRDRPRSSVSVGVDGADIPETATGRGARRCGSDQRAVMPCSVGQRRTDDYLAVWAMPVAGLRTRGRRGCRASTSARDLQSDALVTTWPTSRHWPVLSHPRQMRLRYRGGRRAGRRRAS